MGVGWGGRDGALHGWGSGGGESHMVLGLFSELTGNFMQVELLFKSGSARG